ncbi:hypothetical protein NV226_02620 [Mycoplasma iguanae]|uniref:Uncharacterized protein n=1 Tax=Mycoplasma iguanae TaxID=292461 RepID=A0ABY5RBK5_9MOLU|nr:hypothetical protein [Mycoplasma iguanae]UVD81595.1 hypothetical protein NV226_02620 [Mycoplasma iguanae]
MSKKAILIQNLKYRMKNEYLLKDISFHLSEKNHLGIIYNHQDENKIKIFTNILNYKDNHYQGNIFFYEKLKLKKPIKINDFDLPTFDLLNFNHFKNKKILDVFISIFFRLEPNKLILEKLMKNWKQFSISNNTFILNKEIALMIDFLKNQNKNFKEFIDKWTQPVEQHFKKIKLKNYKEFTTFLDSYIENRENFLKIAAENMVNNQNEIMSLYLNVPDNFYEKFSQINQNYPKISELLVDNEIEDINSLKNNLEELKNKIEELKNKINEKRITVYYFWKYLLEDFKKEIKFAKMSFKNSKNFYDKLFWFKKLKILKIQFSKIKKNRSDLWKLSIPEIIVLLKNLEKYNKEISDKTTFITLNLNNKSKYKIYLELKSLWDFNFYHYKIESKNELNVLSKELQQLEKDYQNLNSKAVKINDYNQEQLVKKISEETFYII